MGKSLVQGKADADDPFTMPVSQKVLGADIHAPNQVFYNGKSHGPYPLTNEIPEKIPLAYLANLVTLGTPHFETEPDLSSPINTTSFFF